MKVKVEKSRQYRYPDLIIYCDHPQFDDKYTDVSAEPDDSPSKCCRRRRSVATRRRSSPNIGRFHHLKEFILVAQDRVSVMHYVRQPDDTWTLKFFADLSDILALPTIGIAIPVEEIYRDVTLLPEDELP